MLQVAKSFDAPAEIVTVFYIVSVKSSSESAVMMFSKKHHRTLQRGRLVSSRYSSGNIIWIKIVVDYVLQI